VSISTHLPPLQLTYRLSSFPYDATAEQYYYKLFLPQDDNPHGYMLREVVEELSYCSLFDVNDSNRTVQVLASSGDDIAIRINMTFEDIVRTWIDRNVFHVLCRQHSERVAIPGAQYGSPVYVERFAAALFGITSQGAHLVAYCNDSSGMKIWIPRRSAHLYTSPGMLDTTVAGGIKSGVSPFQTIVEEAYEEASLPEALIRQRALYRGVISHMNVTGEDFPGEKGLVTPDLISLYDIELPQDVVPRPHDGEVSSFTLMSVEDLKLALLREEFKPDSAAVLVEFLIRHGFITPENEPDFVEINKRLHRRLPFRTG
jgi:8-oxo-dGTP pyrophosphatase MutT (NUDIX family)